MAFPKHHGITLAANSWIENLLVEKLATDPMPIVASRIWHNTTERAIKYSVLDAGGAVIVRTVTSAEEVNAAIASLQSAIDAEVVARDGAISAETAARVAAVAALQAAVTAETAARIQAVADEAASRAAGDQAEAAARVDADAVNAATASDQLATETTARLSGDAALGVRVDDVQAELNATQAGAGLTVDGDYVAPENTTFLAAATSLSNADVMLDLALNTEVATRTAQVVGLGSQLANEAQLRQDGDANLQAQLEALIISAVGDNTASDAAEAAARIAADAGLQSELDQTQASIGLDTAGNIIPVTGTNYLDGIPSIFAGAFALDNQLGVVTQAVADEATARATADTNFFNQLSAETVNRANTDDAQQQEINRIEAGAGLEADGTYASPTGSNYLNLATSLKDADYKLDAAVKSVETAVATINTVAIPDLQAQVAAEATRAAAAEAVNAAAIAAANSTSSAAIAAEEARALAAESVLADSVAAEVTARTAAVSSANAAVAAEVVRATAAEQSLSSSISGEITRAQGVEATLQSAIDAIEAASGEGAAALKSSLNNGRFNYKSPVAALTHTITHNLNTEFYTLQVMVEGSDGVFRNDIVPVEELDALNSLRISLTEARKVKVSVVSNKAIV